ncbi:hypothetical protein K388_07357 [Streptomyces sp. KhCrAH-43]|uniref:hypothetical protein n=1 Tax=unclassified Streptomyces TaxID=2593676 RepID=UPI000369BCE4|nr:MULTISPECIES: hypothetical protein [unclassified Streptomyces]MYS37587.1 hypothetical protein [Streptomyces sp. SID4920]MYX67187.1 hypothetical protein [Streptomyces sp. SID8373]RAJ44945.1 hypothetical protein K388_07357 [Streptomyces sp. KhCrAH-43]
MSRTTPPTLPPLLILAAPAGITTLWVMPLHYGWTIRAAAIASAVVCLAVLLLPLAPGTVAGALRTAAKATRKRKSSEKNEKK